MFRYSLSIISLTFMLVACDTINPPPPTLTPTYQFSASTLEPSRTPYIVPLTRAAPGLEERGVNNDIAARLPANAQMPPLNVTADPNGVLAQDARAQPVQLVSLSGELVPGMMYENLVPMPNATPDQSGIAPLMRTPGILIVGGFINDWGDFPQRLRDAGYTVLIIEVPEDTPTSDFRAFLEALSESNTVNPGLIGVIGAGRGADLALLGCALDLLCDTVVLLSPLGGSTLVNIMPEYGPRPLFVASGTGDPEANSTSIAIRTAARGEVGFQEFESTDRGVPLLINNPDLQNTIALWFNRFLVN